VLWTTNLTKTHSTTLHGKDGQIGFILLKWGEQFSYENPQGRYPWDYIAERDQNRVREWFAAVATGKVQGTCRYALNPAQIGVKDEWTCETSWHLTPCGEFPVLGISLAWSSVVETLSRRERQVAKLLPLCTVKEISVALRLSVSTVKTLKHRVGEKVDLLGPALIAWCQAHGDVL
jgi:DNA-binding CsgD family transcriptional regulator